MSNSDGYGRAQTRRLPVNRPQSEHKQAPGGGRRALTIQEPGSSRVDSSTTRALSTAVTLAVTSGRFRKSLVTAAATWLSCASAWIAVIPVHLVRQAPVGEVELVEQRFENRVALSVHRGPRGMC